MMGGVVQDGFVLTVRGRGVLERRVEFLLREGVVPGLVPLYFYREDLDFVFVYDLEGGYSLEELAGRGEGFVSVGLCVGLLERLEFLVSEFFLELDCFMFDPGWVVFGAGGEVGSFVYCPLMRGDFWVSFLGWFGGVFRGEGWFGEYLSSLERLGDGFSVGSFLEVVRVFDGGVSLRGGVGVSVLDDPVVAKERKGRGFSLGSFVLGRLELLERRVLLFVAGGVFGVGFFWGLLW